MRGEKGQVLLGIGVPLLPVVACDEGGIEVLRTRVSEFIEHPLAHSAILGGPLTTAARSIGGPLSLQHRHHECIVG